MLHELLRLVSHWWITGEVMYSELVRYYTGPYLGYWRNPRKTQLEIISSGFQYWDLKNTGPMQYQ